MKVKLFKGAGSNFDSSIDESINEFIEEGRHQLTGVSLAAENGMVHAMITYVSAKEIEEEEWMQKVRKEQL